MAYRLTWLADVLRAEGLNVVEEDGWKGKGRAEIGEIKGVLCHHTAGAKTGNHPSLGIVKNGRADLPGPLSQLFLARDGTAHVLAAGRCNHAGAGNWHGVTEGNGHLIGIEAENAGTGQDPWPVKQMAAYVSMCAAICRHLKLDEVMVAGHKEYATPKGRKVDPAFDMTAFRLGVGKVIDAKASMYPATVTVEPVRSMLQKGDMGESVKLLQTILKVLPVDGNFGKLTDTAVRAFQRSAGLTPDGKVGPATWTALLPK